MRRLALALALVALPQARAQVTASIYDLSNTPAVASKVHVFAFRDDVFRFDDLGRSRDYDRGPDRWGMGGGYQPFRGPLAGPPVYVPEVFAPDQAVRVRVVIEVEDPSRPLEAPTAPPTRSARRVAGPPRPRSRVAPDATRAPATRATSRTQGTAW